MEVTLFYAMKKGHNQFDLNAYFSFWKNSYKCEGFFPCIVDGDEIPGDLFFNFQQDFDVEVSEQTIVKSDDSIMLMIHKNYIMDKDMGNQRRYLGAISKTFKKFSESQVRSGNEPY